MKGYLRYIKNTGEVKELLNCIGLEYSHDIILALIVINLLFVFHTFVFHVYIYLAKAMAAKVLSKCDWIT